MHYLVNNAGMRQFFSPYVQRTPTNYITLRYEANMHMCTLNSNNMCIQRLKIYVPYGVRSGTTNYLKLRNKVNVIRPH